MHRMISGTPQTWAALLVTAGSIASLAAARVATQPPTQATRVRTAGSDIVSIAIEDFDGDGRKDLAYTQDGLRFLCTVFGRADGTYSLPAMTNLGEYSALLAPGDFNGDGKTDLAIARRDCASASIWLNNGAGGFSMASEVFVGGAPKSILATDLDGDGTLELVVTNTRLPESGETVAIIQRLPNGNYAASGIEAGLFVSTAAAADLDMDGRADLVFGYDNITSVGLAWQGHDAMRRPLPLGGFSPVMNLPASNQGYHPTQVCIANINADALPDIVYFNREAGLVGVVFNDGTADAQRWAGTYGFRDEIDSPAVVADLHRAGKPSVNWVEYNFNTDKFALFRLAVAIRNGAPEIEPVAEWTLGDTAVFDLLAAPDLDGDRDADLIASNGRYVFASGNPDVNKRPLLDGLRFDASQVMRGKAITLTAENARDPNTDGAIREVRFYRDTGNGSFDAADQLIGSDTSPDGGWSARATIDPATAPGTVRFFAVAFDELNEPSDARDNILIVRANSRPTIASAQSSHATRLWGTRVTLSAAGVADPDTDVGDSVAKVEVYIDQDHSGTFTAGDSLVATARPGPAGAWSANFAIRRGMGRGPTTFLVRAADQQGEWSDARPVTITLRARR